MAGNLWPLVPLLCSLASLVGSAALLRWMCLLKGPLTAKLMARQLWHLALADVIASAFGIPWFGVNLSNSIFKTGSQPSLALDAVCGVCMVQKIPLIASVLIEVHIALSMAASVFHLSGALNVLAKIVPLVWFFGLILGSVVMGLSGAVWDASAGHCGTSSMVGEKLEVGLFIAALGICFATYLAVILMVRRHSGESVRARVFRRARLFVVAALVSWSPWAMYVSYSDLAQKAGVVLDPDDPAFNLCYGLLQLNGLLNAAVYLRKSRFARQAWRDARRHSSGGGGRASPQFRHEGSPNSYEVSFKQSPEVVVIMSPMTATMTTSDSAVSDDDDVAPEGDFLICFDVITEGSQLELGSFSSTLSH